MSGSVSAAQQVVDEIRASGGVLGLHHRAHERLTAGERYRSRNGPVLGKGCWKQQRQKTQQS